MFRKPKSKGTVFEERLKQRPHRWFSTTIANVKKPKLVRLVIENEPSDNTKEVEIVKIYIPSCHNSIKIRFYHYADISNVSTDTNTFILQAV